MKTSQSLAAAALLSLAALAPAAVLAQEGAQSPFDALDVDHNGTLSAQEGQGHPVVAQNFASADRNADGNLSREEFNTAFTTRQQTPPAGSPPAGESPSPHSPPK